jgi:signal transduction histidine kinase
MIQVRPYHFVFMLALLALAALGAWWTVFIARAVQAERVAGLSELQHRAIETALRLGYRDQVPAGDDLRPGSELELLPCAAAVQDGAVPVAPKHAAFCVRPSSAAVARLDAKLDRRRFMVMGEGTFLFVLLGVCTVMLWVLLRQQGRNAERMESFFHAVTHEMKTPLTGIRSLIETLARGAVPEARRQRSLALGLENCERLEHAIENVLVAGALRAGQQQFHPVPLRLVPFLEEVAEHRRRSLPEQPEAVCVAEPEGGEDVRVRADPDMLRIVLENLIDNGLKYGGTPPAVEIRVRLDSGWASVDVLDRGVGFEPERAEDLFVPFLRALPQGHGVRHGTGLGLSLARDLCRRMGGDLRARSEGPGRGACFTVALPRNPGGAPA